MPTKFYKKRIEKAPHLPTPVSAPCQRSISLLHLRRKTEYINKENGDLGQADGVWGDGVNLGLPRALLPSLDNFRNYETTTNHSSFVLNVTIELIDIEGSRREILEAFWKSPYLLTLLMLLKLGKIMFTSQEYRCVHTWANTIWSWKWGYTLNLFNYYSTL